MPGFGQSYNGGGGSFGNTSFGGGLITGGGSTPFGQGQGTKKPEKKYCIEDLLKAIEVVESGGNCKAKSPGWDLASFGPFQISKGYFDIAVKKLVECGKTKKCKKYPWLIEKTPSVMCKNADDEERARAWSRCVVISYMFRYANQGGKGNIPDPPGKSYQSPGADEAPHNDSPWMRAIVVDRKTGKTDHAATAKKRRKMTRKDKRSKGQMHGPWDPGGERYGGGKKDGAMDRLCKCKGTLKDCELVARMHNGGSLAGNSGDPRPPYLTKEGKLIDPNKSSLRRWDNTTNYWGKVQRHLTPTGK